MFRGNKMHCSQGRIIHFSYVPVYSSSVIQNIQRISLVWKGKSVLLSHTIHPNNVLGFLSIHGSVADSVHLPLHVVIGTRCQFGCYILMSQLGCYQTVLSRHKERWDVSVGHQRMHTMVFQYNL